MEKKKQRVHTAAFKTQVVLALLKGDKTANEVCS
jgi:transposase-like protein